MDQPFKWRHDQAELLLLCVRWYLRYSLSDRALEEMRHERGLGIDPPTIYRWVQHSAPEVEQRVKPHRTPSNDSWRVDEPYGKVKQRGMYRYRAGDSAGNTFEFRLSDRRNARAAKRLFCNVVTAQHTVPPRASTVDKHAAYPTALRQLRRTKRVVKQGQLRQRKDWNNSVEHDHRFIKRLVPPGRGVAWCETATRARGGSEVMHMLRTGQLHGTPKGHIRSQVRFIATVFGIMAYIPLISSLTTVLSLSTRSLQHNRY